MALVYEHKKAVNGGSISVISDAVIDSFNRVQINVPIYRNKYLAQLRAILDKFKSDSLFNTQHAHTKEAIDLLEEELSTDINVLFSSELGQADINFFQGKFELSLRKVDQQFHIAKGTDMFSAMYHKIVRPALMALMGSIIAVLMSPVLPFSASARHYVGSFFNSHLLNTLKSGFSNMREDITKDVVSVRNQLQQR